MINIKNGVSNNLTEWCLKQFTNFLAKFRLSKSIRKDRYFGLSYFFAPFQKVCKPRLFSEIKTVYKHLFSFKFQMLIFRALKKCQNAKSL